MPEELAGVTAGEMEVEGLRVLADPAADLEQAEPQRVQLPAGYASLHECAAQGVEQPAGGRRSRRP
jgi:hypothetical protein